MRNLTESVMPALDYNENKVLLGVAEVVGYANLECADYDHVYDVFSRMQKTPYLIQYKNSVLMAIFLMTQVFLTILRKRISLKE